MREAISMQSAPMPISMHLALLTIGVAQLAVEVRQLRDLSEELGLSRKCLVQDLALLT